MTIAVSSISSIQDELNKLYKAYTEATGDAKTDASKKLDDALQKYTGPAVGLLYDEKVGVVNIAGGWHADANGFLVKG